MRLEQSDLRNIKLLLLEYGLGRVGLAFGAMKAPLEECAIAAGRFCMGMRLLDLRKRRWTSTERRVAKLARAKEG